jgi:hypothetical protein
MKIHLCRSGLLLCFVAFSVTLMGCSDSSEGRKPSEQNKWATWLESLASARFEVTQGTVWLMEADTNCPKLVDVFSSCFANNAAAPYLIPRYPVSGSYESWYTITSGDEPKGDGTYFESTEGDLWGESDGTPYNAFFRVADNEAFVQIVNLPPSAAYFGSQSYVFTRDVGYYEDQGYELTPKCSELDSEANYDPPTVCNPDYPQFESINRISVFASLGDAINDEEIRRRDEDLDWGGGTVVIITTHNKSLADELVREASDAGLDEGRIFIEEVYDNTSLGKDEDSDEFISLIRYALPEDEAAGNAWKANRSENILTYRVAASDAGYEGYGAPFSDNPTGYGEKESTEVEDGQGYAESLNELGGILKDWIDTEVPRSYHLNVDASNLEMDISTECQLTGDDTVTPCFVGKVCLENYANCFGDSQDTDSYRFGGIGWLLESDVMFVIGVNHTKLDAATYLSLSFYDTVDAWGKASSSQTNGTAVGFSQGDFNGSAENVLGALGLLSQVSATLNGNLSDLYVIVVNREKSSEVFNAICSNDEGPCVTLSEQDLGYEPDDILTISQRAYIKPGSTRGTAPGSLINSRVVGRQSNPFGNAFDSPLR